MDKPGSHEGNTLPTHCIALESKLNILVHPRIHKAADEASDAESDGSPVILSCGAELSIYSFLPCNSIRVINHPDLEKYAILGNTNRFENDVG